MTILKKVKNMGCSFLKRYYYRRMELVAKNKEAEDNIKKAYNTLVIMDFLDCDMPLLKEKLKKTLHLKLELCCSPYQKP